MTKEDTELFKYQQIVKETEMAILIKFEGENMYWLPKSVIINTNKVTKNIQVKNWFVKRLKADLKL